MFASNLVPSAYLLSLAMCGCAMQKYRAAPISPAESAAEFQARNLDDPGLKQFVEKNAGRELSEWPPKSWDLKTLTLAAYYFNSDLEVERSRVALADAAIVTAGARPNPNLGIIPGVPSPYLLELDLGFPIETAGKRGHRLEGARSRADAAHFELASMAWKVRSKVRTGLLNHFLAVRSLDLLQTQAGLLSGQVKLLETRFTVGEIPRPEVDAAKVSLFNSRLAIHVAEGRVNETKAALASAIGVPAEALAGIEFAWPNLDHPPETESLTPESIQSEAVLNRLDVRQALAEYAAAEADLKLEIAKQYPDIAIGPGYRFEERDHFFTVGFSTKLPLFNRNQGPIAEAEARRKQAAGRFLSAQAQVIAQSEKALARYRAALAELSEAEGSLAKVQAERERMARRALALGETDRLTLNGVELQSAAAALAKLDALHRAQAALGELEDAVQRPLQEHSAIPASPPPPASKGEKP